ncbi:MAG TPA: amylo-alpha-1,6-glucosidase [Bacteroidota bacterium]
MRRLLLFPLLLLAGCSGFLPDQSLTIESLGIDVFGASRELGYTNKSAGFLYTETNAEHHSGWYGWHVMSHEILDDYVISVDDREIRKSSVHLAQVYPHQFRRSYPNGAQETVTLLDSVDAIVVELSIIKGTSITLRPLFSGSPNPDDYITRSHGDVLLIAAKSHLTRTPEADYPVWVGVTVSGVEKTIDTGAVRSGQGVGPGAVRAAILNGAAVAVLAAGETEDQTIDLIRRVAARYKTLIEQRRNRMQDLIDRVSFRTTDDRFDRAFHWALLSMDALVMHQGKKGIFAGLPWFSNYWGRDTFIALPGATLVQGNFSDAREILRSFAEWQDTNRSSTTYGRIPNLVTPSSIVYNTADGTPRFVEALGEYASYSGDTSFVRTLYPVILRANEGALKHRTDRYGLMTHDDAETWMDAVGPEGPWSPRGNRANDIQALWYNQLLISSWIAGLVNDEVHFREWFSYAEQVRLSFNRLFLEPDSSRMFDHLNADGTHDNRFRPNQLLALSLVENPDLRFWIFKQATEELVYPHGVASLSQNDANFHPYHHHRPFYVQDAAYHNGIVWTWLAGPWITAATQYRYTETAYTVTENMIDQILDRGAVGTMSELLDAVPREGESEPRLSGTFSQAWSLAEFLRNAFQDYLGVRVDAVEHRLELAPRLPSTITKASFNVAVGNHVFRVRYDASSSDGRIQVSSPDGAPTIDVVVTWRHENGIEHNFASMLGPGTEATMTIEAEGVYVDDQTGSHKLQMDVIRPFDPDSSLVPVSLARPVVRPGLKALKGPDHRLLTNAEIKTANPEAVVVYQTSDPASDDRGPGRYVYPRSPHLREGSLDITGFTVAADDSNAYFTLRFRTLSNPGWHPEYGFQLTYAAIAIDKDGRRNSGTSAVGRNANYRLPADRGFEAIVYVGGGVRIEDRGGIVLAEYLPASGDETNPLGDASTCTISFAIPQELIDKPLSTWKYTVLVGAQDDHGGAGLGEFRNVEARAGEWTGGGRQKPTDPNIYDFIIP